VTGIPSSRVSIGSAQATTALARAPVASVSLPEIFVRNRESRLRLIKMNLRKSCHARCMMWQNANLIQIRKWVFRKVCKKNTLSHFSPKTSLGPFLRASNIEFCTASRKRESTDSKNVHRPFENAEQVATQCQQGVVVHTQDGRLNDATSEQKSNSSRQGRRAEENRPSQKGIQ